MTIFFEYGWLRYVSVDDVYGIVDESTGREFNELNGCEPFPRSKSSRFPFVSRTEYCKRNRDGSANVRVTSTRTSARPRSKRFSSSNHRRPNVRFIYSFSVFHQSDVLVLLVRRQNKGSKQNVLPRPSAHCTDPGRYRGPEKRRSGLPVTYYSDTAVNTRFLYRRVINVLHFEYCGVFFCNPFLFS